MKKIVEKIYFGKWDDEVLNTIKNTRRDILYKALFNFIGDKEKANELLKESLDRAGVRYTTCKTTGFVITYLIKGKYYNRVGTRHDDGRGNEYYDVFNGGISYFCPHCEKEIFVWNDDAAIDIIKGNVDEDGYLKE